MTKKILLISLMAASVFIETAHAQAPTASLQATYYYNITASSLLDGAGYIDNRSQFTRQNNYHSFYATGTGTWSITMQYADGTPTGWQSFGGSAVISQSTTAIGFGIGYHDFIKFAFTGIAVISNYSAAKNFWFPGTSGSGSIVFPITVGQGGTGATTAAGARTNLGAAASGSNSDITSLTAIQIIDQTGPASSTLTIGEAINSITANLPSSTTIPSQYVMTGLESWIGTDVEMGAYDVHQRFDLGLIEVSRATCAIPSTANPGAPGGYFYSANFCVPFAGYASTSSAAMSAVGALYDVWVQVTDTTSLGLGNATLVDNITSPTQTGTVNFNVANFPTQVNFQTSTGVITYEFYARVDNEWIVVINPTQATSGTVALTVVARGLWGSTPVTHSSGATVYMSTGHYGFGPNPVIQGGTALGIGGEANQEVSFPARIIGIESDLGCFAGCAQLEGMLIQGVSRQPAWEPSHGVLNDRAGAYFSTSLNAVSVAGLITTYQYPHKLQVGDLALIQGCQLSAYNGLWNVASVIDSLNFTIAAPVGGGNANTYVSSTTDPFGQYEALYGSLTGVIAEGMIITGSNVSAGTTVLGVNPISGQIVFSTPPSGTPGNLTFTVPSVPATTGACNANQAAPTSTVTKLGQPTVTNGNLSLYGNATYNIPFNYGYYCADGGCLVGMYIGTLIQPFTPYTMPSASAPLQFGSWNGAFTQIGEIYQTSGGSVQITDPNGSMFSTFQITLNPLTFNWTQYPGGTVTAGSSVTITLPGGAPRGVNGTNSNFYVELSNTAGTTTESDLVTGGTCVSAPTGPNGVPCTLILASVANNYSGVWTVSSSNNGGAEAFWFNGGAGGVEIHYPQGSYVIHGPIAGSSNGAVISGAGRVATTLTVAADFPVTGPNAACAVIICFNNTTNPNVPATTLQDMTIVLPQPFAACSSPCSLSGFKQYPPVAYIIAGALNAKNLRVDGAWTGFYIHSSPDNATPIVFGGQSDSDDVQISAYGPMGAFNIAGQGDQIRLSKTHCWPYTNGINLTAAFSAYFGPTVRCLVTDGGSEGVVQTTGTASASSTALAITSGTLTANGQGVTGPGISSGTTITCTPNCGDSGPITVTLNQPTYAAIQSASTTATAASGANILTLASGTNTHNGQLISGAGIPAGTFVVYGGSTNTVGISQLTTAPLSTTAVTFTSQITFFINGMAGSDIMLDDFESNAGVAIDMGNASQVTATNSWFETFGAIKTGFTGNAILNISASTFFHNDATSGINCSQPSIWVGSQPASITFTGNKVLHYCGASPFWLQTNPSVFYGLFAATTITGNTFEADKSFPGNAAQPSVFVFDGAGPGGSGAVTNLSGNTITYTGNVTYTQPMLNDLGALFQIGFTGNQSNSVGGGTWFSAMGTAPYVTFTGNTMLATGTWTPIAFNQVDGNLVITGNNGIDDIVPTVTSAALAAGGNIPLSPQFVISGTSTIGTIYGVWRRAGTFYTTGAVPFVTGGNINQNCTTTAGWPYSYTYDGATFYIIGHGCY